MSVFITPKGLSATHGGPGSFARTFSVNLASKDIDVQWGLKSGASRDDSILVINATRELPSLVRARLHGTKIVQRLGLPPTSFKNLSSSRGVRGSIRLRRLQMITNFIRKRLATHVVYQSEFTKKMWHDNYGPSNASEHVILNGVDTGVFDGHSGSNSVSDNRLVLVEGNLSQEVHDTLANLIPELEKHLDNFSIEIYGHAPKDFGFRNLSPAIVFKGFLPPDELAKTLPGAKAYLLTDVLSACPNSLLEAMACGVPSIAYDFGPIRELVTENTGVLIPSVGNPHLGEQGGNENMLANGFMQIVENYDTYSEAARSRIATDFRANDMAEKYLALLSG